MIVKGKEEPQPKGKPDKIFEKSFPFQRRCFYGIRELTEVVGGVAKWGQVRAIFLSLKASSSRRTPTRLDTSINNQQTKLKLKIESLCKVNQEPNPKSPQTWHHSPTPSPIDIKFPVRTESISSCFMKSESWKGGEPSKHWLFIFYAQKGKISRSLSFRHEQLISKLINRLLDLFIYFTEKKRSISAVCASQFIGACTRASCIGNFRDGKTAQTIVGVSRLFTFLRSARADQQQRKRRERG